MTKREELENPNSTWNRTADDEPVFILCGRDKLTPDVIPLWAQGAESIGVDPRKIAAAREFNEHVKAWQAEHPERVKVPDYVEGEQ